MAIIRLDIEVDKKGAVKDVKTFNKELEKSKKSANKATTAFKKMAGGLKKLATSWIGLTAIVVSFVKVVKDSVQAFLIQEKAEKNLAAALKITGQLTEENLQGLLKFAAERQKITTFGDELTIQNLSLLASFKQNTEQMKLSSIAAQDLSVGLGIDLRAATLLVGKAFAGDIATLSRYGIKIEEGLDKTKKFDAVLKQIRERFGGRAQAEVDTYAGKIKQLSNIWGDFTEKLGKIFIPVITKVVKFLRNTIVTLSEMADVVSGFFAKISGNTKKTEKDVENLATGLKNVGDTGKESAEKLGKAFDALEIFPKKKMEEQAKTLIDSFKEAVRSGKLSGNDLLSTRKALFAKLEQLNKQKGEAAFTVGFEGIQKQLIKEFDATRNVSEVKFAEFAGIAASAGKDIGKGLGEAFKIPQEAIKRTADTMFVTFERVKINSDKFIQETINLAKKKFPILQNIFKQHVDAAISAEKKITESVSKETRERVVLYEDANSIVLRDTSNFVENMVRKLDRIRNAAVSTKEALSGVTGTLPTTRTTVPVFGGTNAGFQKGTPFVPHTGNFKLHQGEAVIPANQNPFNQTTNNVTNNFDFSGGNVNDSMSMRRNIRRAQKASGVSF